MPLCFVEEEMARRYQQAADSRRRRGIGLPGRGCRLAPDGRAYALCAQLQSPDPANPEYQARIATILHRCIYYTGMIILEHYRRAANCRRGSGSTSTVTSNRPRSGASPDAGRRQPRRRSPDHPLYGRLRRALAGGPGQPLQPQRSRPQPDPRWALLWAPLVNVAQRSRTRPTFRPSSSN